MISILDKYNLNINFVIDDEWIILAFNPMIIPAFTYILRPKYGNYLFSIFLHL